MSVPIQQRNNKMATYLLFLRDKPTGYIYFQIWKIVAFIKEWMPDLVQTNTETKITQTFIQIDMQNIAEHYHIHAIVL